MDPPLREALPVGRLLMSQSLAKKSCPMRPWTESQLVMSNFIETLLKIRSRLILWVCSASAQYGFTRLVNLDHKYSPPPGLYLLASITSSGIVEAIANNEVGMELSCSDTM